MASKYPVLREKFILHRQMGRFLVVNLASLTSEITNETGGYILSLCNGRNSINTIIGNCSRKYGADVNEISDFISGYIQEARSHGYIEMLSSRQYRHIKMTGSDKIFAPMSFSVEITKRCQLSCSHCYAGLGQRKMIEDIPYEQIQKMFTFFKRNGAVNVFLTGGEAILHPQFEEILMLAADQFFAVELVSNGFAVTDHAIELLKKYNSKGTIGVQISIDGLRDYHNAFRGNPKAFDNCINAVKSLSKSGIQVRIGMNVTPANLSMIKELAVISKSLGAFIFRIGSVLPLGDAINDIEKLSDANMHEIAEIWRDMLPLEDEKFLLQTPHDFQRLIGGLDVTSINCGAGCALCHIETDGTVTACPLLPLPLGNIFRESEDKIFAGHKASIFAEIPTPNKDLCGDCDELVRCENCHAVAWSRNRYNTDCAWVKLYRQMISDNSVSDDQQVVENSLF